MKDSFKKDRAVFTVSEIYDMYKSEKLNFNVGYQRESGVWEEDAKSFLIDSIFKNYPIPAVYLNPKIDDEGRTVYDVVDGKQRLETIIAFIENKISLTKYFAIDEVFDKKTEELAKKIQGLKFQEIQKDRDNNSYFIKQFWTYSISVEMIYEDNYDLISGLFDRLNRNGEPLNNQELLNAKYSNSHLLNTVERLADNSFWIDKLKKTVRMENLEFISEILFTIQKKEIITTAKKELNNLYEKNSNISLEEIFELEKDFNKITDTLISFNIDFDKYKRLYSTTHLFTLFLLAMKIYYEKTKYEKFKPAKINEFYNEYFYNYDSENMLLEKYYLASSNGTHSAKCRTKRLECLLKYCC